MAEIALSLLVSNTDDHLRNHGFLRESTAGWRLSPVFDLNPNPGPGSQRLTTTIAFGSPDTIETLLEVAGLFRLTPREAPYVLAEVAEATSHWREVAAANALSPAAIERMEPAFVHEIAEEAHELAVA